MFPGWIYLWVALNVVQMQPVQSPYVCQGQHALRCVHLRCASRSRQQGASQKSNEAIAKVPGLEWVNSYVVAEQTYCIYKAPSEVCLLTLPDRRQQAISPKDTQSVVGT